MIRSAAVWIASLSLGLAVPGLIQAQTQALGSASDPSVLKAMFDCRKLPTKDQRADCYDGAVDSLSRAQSEGKVVVIDQEKIKTVRRQAFGFNLPSLSILSRGFKEEPIDVVSLKITETHETNDERWVMQTNEGATWRQTQSSGFPLTPHTGSSLVIKPGFLGSFFCQVDRQAPFRCKREQ